MTANQRVDDVHPQNSGTDMASIVQFLPDGKKIAIINCDELDALIETGWVLADSLLRPEPIPEGWNQYSYAKILDYPLRGSFAIWYRRLIEGSFNRIQTKIWDAYYFENAVDAVEFRLRFC